MRASIISSAAGNTPPAIVPVTVDDAASIESNAHSIVATAGGSGMSRTATRVVIPIVPSEPTKQPRRS